MITISKIRQGRGGWQYVFIALTADGDTCRMTVTTPKLDGADLQAYCNNREAEYQLNILQAMYPDARYQDLKGKTELDKFEAWISAGCVNTAYEDEEEGKLVSETVIKKVPWTDTWDGGKVQAEIDLKKSVLYNKTDAQIQTYIDNNITDMQSAKVYLYKLTKAVRDIVRRQGWEE